MSTQLQSRRTPGRSTLRTAIPFVVFLFFLGLWTYELLAENPVPPSISRAIPDPWKFWLAKGLHVAGYAFLTVLAAILPIPRIYFWLVIAFLVLHGIATEVGQTHVAGRHGSIRDVALDWVGVGIGLAILWPLGKLRGRRAPESYGDW
jgi:VanZ family protein